jgi:antirestriction protein ArdC
MPSFENFKDADCFYATSFHELGHWTAHKSRLDRDLKTRFGSRDYAAEELVAELASAFLCAEFGINKEVRHASYLAHWIAARFPNRARAAILPRDRIDSGPQAVWPGATARPGTGRA